MESRTPIILSEKERKEIYSYKQLKKKRKLEQEERENKKNQKGSFDLDDILTRAVDIAMDEMAPSYKKFEKLMFENADSAWFALSELDRFKAHFEKVHRQDESECKEGCLEDFTMENAKEYMNTIMKAIEKEI